MTGQSESPSESSLAFDDRACLVAGSAKSGTTLIVALLDGHPGLLAFPEETAYFPTVLGKYLESDRQTQMDYLTTKAESRLLFAEEPLPGLRDYSAFPRRQYREQFEAAALDPANSERDLLAIMMQSYAEVTGQPIDQVVRWIEKTPANRRCLGPIRSRFPSAKVILMMRDPRAILAAFLQRERKNPTGRFSLYLCAGNWLESARVAIDPGLDQNSLHIVRFEDLLLNPEPTLRGVCEFLEVDFDQVVLQPTKAGVSWAGNSTSGQTFKSVDTAPVDNWKSILSPKEIEWLELHCHNAMKSLGYEPVSGKAGGAVWWHKFPEESGREYIKSRRYSIRDRVKGYWKPPGAR